MVSGIFIFDFSNLMKNDGKDAHLAIYSSTFGQMGMGIDAPPPPSRHNTIWQ